MGTSFASLADKGFWAIDSDFHVFGLLMISEFNGNPEFDEVRNGLVTWLQPYPLARLESFGRNVQALIRGEFGWTAGDSRSFDWLREEVGYRPDP